MTINIYESSKSKLTNDSVSPVTLSRKEILFSFRGRIGRSTYWISLLCVLGYMLLIMPVISLLAFRQEFDIPVDVLFFIPLIWISLAIHIKRWHDRDKSGWFVLVALIPVIGTLWVLIENGCLAGCSTINRFGPPQT